MKSDTRSNSIRYQNQSGKMHLFLALLLAIQAIFFSIFVTPPADIPDESGHYAYVVDLAKGRPFPVYSNVTNGRGVIEEDLWVDWGPKSDHIRANYIVQHPPLYYAVAAIPYVIAKQFTDDRITLAHAARLVSGIFLGLLFLVLFKTLSAAGLRPSQALMMASWLPLLPMTTHLSSGITNDIFLVLMCALATLYLVKFTTTQTIRYAYYCAFWLACAGATKMTAWVLIAAFVGILIYELRRPIKSWLVHSALISATSVITALWWMNRNYYWFGNPFFIAGSETDGDVIRTPISYIDFFQDHPFFQWLMFHTYGLLGFTGYCLSASGPEALAKFCKGAELVVTTGPSYWIAIVAMAISGAAVWWALIKQQPPLSSGQSSVQSLVSERIFGCTPVTKVLSKLLLIGGLLSAVLVVVYGFKFTFWQGTLTLLVFGLFLGASFSAVARVLTPSQIHVRLIAYGTLVLALFTLTLFSKSHGAFEIENAMRGVQGRYLFAFYPLLMVGVGLAMMKHRLWQPVVWVITLSLVWAHLNAYTNEYIPFFNYVRL